MNADAEHRSLEYLDQMRLVGDPLGDDVIAAVVEHGETQDVDKLMASLILNDDLVPQDLPENVRNYLVYTARLPDWADEARIAVAQDLFLMYTPEIILLLFYSSLPTAYLARKGAQVLALTRRLEQGYIYRRIIETAQFIVDVMTPGGLGPEGHGIRSAQKVRLMHAAIRHYIQHDQRWQVSWDPEWGTPINQEDLAGTLMTFSLIILDGLRRFDIQLQPEQEEAYLHAWNVVGFLLGVRQELLPGNMSDARALMDRILQRQWAPSQAGTNLAAALVGFLNSVIPFWLRGMPQSAVRYFRGDGVADQLGVGRANWTTSFLRLQTAVYGSASRRARVSRVFGWFSRQLHLVVLSSILSVSRDGNRPPFRIPDRLRPRLRIRRRRPRRVRMRMPNGEVKT